MVSSPDSMEVTVNLLVGCVSKTNFRKITFRSLALRTSSMAYICETPQLNCQFLMRLRTNIATNNSRKKTT